MLTKIMNIRNIDLINFWYAHCAFDVKTNIILMFETMVAQMKRVGMVSANPLAIGTLEE